jgi:hypothetical protein
VRDVAPRAAEALGEAAADGFASVRAADARGWFKKCSYYSVHLKMMGGSALSF